MANEAITFHTDLDNTELQKKLKETEESIKLLQEKLSTQKNARNPLAEKVSMLSGVLDEANAKLVEMRNAGTKLTSMADQEDTVASLAWLYSEAADSLDLLDAGIQGTTTEIERQKETAGDLTQQIEQESAGVGSRIKALFASLSEKIKGAFKGTFSTIGKVGRAAFQILKGAAGKALTAFQKLNVFSKIFGAIGSKLQQIGKKIGGVLISTVATKGLDGLQARFKRYLSANKELSDAFKRMNGALATAFQPIFSAAMPALVALTNMVTRAAAAIATLVAAMFGTTQKQAAQNVKALSAEADALEKTGGAAEDAVLSMAGFDEISQLPGGEKTGGGGASEDDADFSGLDNATVFDSWGQAFSTFLDGVLVGIPSLESALGGFSDKLNEVSSKLLEAFTFPGVQEKVRELGSGLATAINGLVADIDWGTLGAALGAGLGTALTLLVSFLYTFDWLNFGASLAAAVNGVVAQINWSDFGQLLWAGVKIAIETLAGFLLNLDMAEVASALSETAIGFFTAISDTFRNIDWVLLGEQVKNLLVNMDWGGIAIAVFEAIGLAFGAATAFLWGLVKDAWQAVVDWWHAKAFEDGSFTLQGLLDGIIQVVSSIGTWINENIIVPFMTGFRDAFGIHSPSTLMAEQGGYIMEGLFNGITSLIETVLAPFGEIKDRAKEILGGIIDFVTGVFSGDWSKAWEGVQDIFKGVWNGIISTLEGAINFVIAGINWLIAQLNKVHFDVPAWVPVVGGKSIGIKIPPVNPVEIPRLAKGAVIPPNRAFMAVLGDQRNGVNIEAPLDTMVQAFRAAARDIPVGSGDTTVIMELDGYQLGKATFNAYNRESRRIGVRLAEV